MKVDIKANPKAIGIFQCFLDGKDISAETFAASEEEGWADCYMRGPEGGLWRDGGRILTERRYGHIQLVKRSAREIRGIAWRGST